MFFSNFITRMLRPAPTVPHKHGVAWEPLSGRRLLGVTAHHWLDSR
jgi:hypothetical protein